MCLCLTEINPLMFIDYDSIYVKVYFQISENIFSMMPRDQTPTILSKCE